MARVSKSFVLGGLVGVPLLGLAAGWAVGVPSLVKARARAAIEGRLAFSSSIEDASIGFGRVSLEGVRLRGRHGGVDIRIGEVRVLGGLFGLATRGTEAIDRVELDGVRAEVDLREEGAGRTLSELAARPATGGGDTEPDGGAPSVNADQGRVAPVVEIRGLEVRVEDGGGSLVELEGGRLTRRGGRVEADLAALTVGGDSGSSFRATDVHAVARRGEGGHALESITFGSAEVDLVARAPEEDETPEAEDGPEAQAAGAPPPGTRERLEALAAALRPAAEPAASPGAPSAAAGGGPWRRLAPGGIVRVDDVTVRTRGQGGEAVLMRELRGTITAEEIGHFHLEGSGRTDGSGTLRWDLRAVPGEMRGEGTIAFRDLPLALVSPLMPSLPWYEPERARLDGELVVSADSVERLSFEGNMALRNAAIASARVAPDPVFDIAFSAQGSGHFVPRERRLELASATVRVGRAEATLEGAVEWAPDHYLFDLRALLPSTRCSTALAAIPTDLLGGLVGFDWSGRIGGRLVARVDSRDLDAAVLDIDVFDGCRFETVAAVADLRRFQRPFLHEVIEPDGTIFSMTTGPGTDAWTSIHAISPFLLQAVIAHEDAAFFRHGGFSTGAIRDALVRNLEAGRYVVGASTITMQLAKNLFLHREKTLARKVQEVLLTWWLESYLSKEEILELYVNVIEYGPAVYGIRNAAMHYFGRDPAELSPAESVFLSAVLPNPKMYHASYQRGRLSESMRNRMRRQLHHMRDRERIDQAALDYGLAELEDFHFHADDAPPPPPRILQGHAGELPFATYEAGEDPWEWEGTGEAPAHTAVVGGYE